MSIQRRPNDKEDSKTRNGNLPAQNEGITTLDELRDFEKIVEKLRSMDWDFEKENTSQLTHDVHPYTAKFIPSIPRQLILNLSVPGERVWDPFSGSGTTAVEAVRLNRSVLCSDKNPLSSIIGRTKVTPLNEEDLKELHELLDRISLFYREKINDSGNDDLFNNIPQIPNIEKWFNKDPIKELAFIKKNIEKLTLTASKNIALTALSVTVSKVSNQKSETQYSSVHKIVKSGETVKIYADEIKRISKKVALLKSGFPKDAAQFITLDIREPLSEIGLIKKDSIDFVITSPPYPNSFDYHLYHRFRLFWLGFDPKNFGESEIGSHLRNQRQEDGFGTYLTEMKLALENIYYALRPGRYAVVIVGDGIYGGRVYNTAEELSEVSRKIGFVDSSIIIRSLHKSKRSVGPSARRLEKEQILILRKPPQNTEFKLTKPNYKLWGYEEMLRREEILELLKVPLFEDKNGDSKIVTDFLNLDKLRRLTFTKDILIGTDQKISTWQSILENGIEKSKDKNEKRRESKYASHGIHQYKGKFYPQLVKSLLNISCTQPGSLIFDPFCGSGTVLLEAHLNGMASVGVDVNPMAVEISRAKLDILDVDVDDLQNDVDRLISSLSKLNREYSQTQCNYIKGNSEVENWFPQPVIAKLNYIINNISKFNNNAIKRYFTVVLSSIIREISQQDTDDLRIRKRKVLIEDAPVFELFVKALKLHTNRVVKYLQNKHKSPNSSKGYNIGEVNNSNLQEIESAGIRRSSVDRIITSPPYATALPYIDTDRLSLLVLQNLDSKTRSKIERVLIGSREISNKEKSEIESYIIQEKFTNIISETAKKLINEVYGSNLSADLGFRRKNMAALLFRYFSEMTSSFRNMDYVLKSGGDVFIVIGNNFTVTGKGRIEIETAKILEETGKEIGWKLIKSIPITVTTENLNHIKNSIKRNEVLWFRKENA